MNDLTHIRDQIECLKCTLRFDSSALFCGFCGAPVARQTVAMNAIVGPEEVVTEPAKKHDFFVTDTITIDDDAFDDFGDLDLPKSKVFAISVIAMSVLAVGIMSFVLFLQTDGQKKPSTPVVDVRSPSLNEGVQVAKESVDAIRFSLAKKKKIRELSAKGVLIQIEQAKDSRYKNTDKRAESILLRLNHALDKIQKGECERDCFKVVKKESHSEVQFVGRSGAPFRLLDITKKDVGGKKITLDDRAQRIVKQLNTLLETQVGQLASNLHTL